MATPKDRLQSAFKTFQGRKLYRSESDRMLAGVCGGLGEYFGLDSTLFRLGFVFLTLFGGGGAILYVIGWIVIPTESDIRELPR